MRVTQAIPQSQLHRLKHRAPLVAGMICVALAMGGCASTSTLGEKKSDLKAEDAPVVAAKGAQVKTISQLQKFMWFFSPYRPDIQQGNFISQEMLQQLKPGMTRDQVKFILGTPLLTDIFHADRWDYPFRLARGNGETIESTVVVFFKEGKVDRYEGGNLPTEQEYIALIAGPPKNAKDALKQKAAAPVNTQPMPSGQDRPAPSAVEIDIKPKTESK
ncbi:outer membrane protein assembly factor BamE [Pseudoduganella namucuonensis]|uniref:Outer membrane protein assembly factor BamE n=1 Tax=Pseudoduganella namucuonensis TaxID=1035707 RepID=A0A1I7M161_9BURK|nr:outer membrane protein assembly factor BamE [Pseudoduganella namucuonensis]SFV15674.1 outer membrane protein assembly factor BamE [Pseudoduganella namucuonensis]